MRLRLAGVLLVGAAVLSPVTGATPPAQPPAGPGGADYREEQVIKRAVGTASAATYVYHAAGPAAAARPVVVFFHPWGGTNPQLYGGWIDHLARKGYLVLWPRFQEVGRTRPAEASDLASRLVQEALASLGPDPDARPDPARIAFVGHLAGAAVALNVAATAGQGGPTAPKLILAVMPGGIAQEATGRGIVLADLGQLEPSTLLITLSGDRDHQASDRTGRRILKESTSIPANRKLFMRVPSDSHGFPVLSATLASPASPKDGYDAAAIPLPPDPSRASRSAAPRSKWTAEMALTGEQITLSGQLANNPTDTLDYLAYWKTLDWAAEAAFADRDAVSLRGDPKFLSMGFWSDSWPVKRLTAEIPRAEGQDEPSPKPGPRRRLDAGTGAPERASPISPGGIGGPAVAP